MSSDIHALSGAYAVDALDDAERAEFEEHLATCDSCQEEVADLQLAASQIAATTEIDPPPGVRDAVLAGIRDVRPLPPVVPRPDAHDVGQNETHDEPRAEVRRLPRRRFRSIGLVAAAAALVTGGVTVGVHPWEDHSERPPSASQVMAASDVKRFSADLPHGASLTVYRSVEMDRAVVVTTGLRPAPAGRTYELWLENRSGHLEAAGLFSDGSNLTQLVRGRAGAAKGLGITVEPAGGSEQPTTAPMALVALT